jgi:hypothetical protein
MEALALLDRAAAWIEAHNRMSDRQAAFVRVCFGLLVLLTSIQLIVWDYPLARTGFFFNLPLLDTDVLHAPSEVHAAIIYLLPVTAAAIVLGLRARAAALCAAGILYYTLLADLFAFHHGLVFIANCMLAVAFIEDVGSRSYGVLAIKVLTSLVLGFSAVHKMDAYFLSGAIVEEIAAPSSPAFLTWAAGYLPVWSVLAWIALGVEASVPWLLWMPRWRSVAILLGCALHVGITQLAQVGLLFNVSVAATYLCFCELSGPRPPEVEYSPASALMRGLRRLDVLRSVAWRPTEEPGRGRRMPLRLAPRLILINPVFVAFAVICAGWFVAWTPDAAARAQETVIPRLASLLRI